MIEKSEVKVSVVMPILNTAAYIRECMESLVNQTLREIEILCVDAYSTDGTREILEEYVRRDGRVRILNEDKKSTGYANNLGIRCASGKYVAILEPDDYVELHMYERLYLAAEKENCDVVRADYQVFWGDGKERIFLDKPVARQKRMYHKILSAKDDKTLYLNDMSTWAGIYRKDFLMKNHIWHNETPGASYQDNGFWFQVMALAERILYLPISGYRYRLDNPCSSIHSQEKAFAICDEFNFIQNRMEEEGSFKSCQSIFVYMKYVRYIGSFYRLHKDLQLPFAERFFEEMREHLEKREINWQLFSPVQREMLEELLISPGAFINYICCRQQKLTDFLMSQKEIVQFGCGSDGIRFLSYMKDRKEKDKIVCITDNNPKLQQGSVFGIPLSSPKEVRKRYPDCGYVITSINYGEDIKRQLEESGVSRNQIMIGCLC